MGVWGRKLRIDKSDLFVVFERVKNEDFLILSCFFPPLIVKIIIWLIVRLVGGGLLSSH